VAAKKTKLNILNYKKIDNWNTYQENKHGE